MSKFPKCDLENLYFYKSEYEKMRRSVEDEYYNEKTEYYKDKIKKEIKEIDKDLKEINDLIRFRENEDLQDYMDLFNWDDD